MALSLLSRYPSQVDASDASYPFGKARNVATSGDGSGTPWEKDLVNDFLGFLQSLLSSSKQTPSGAPDKVGASQYADGVAYIARADSKPRDTLLALSSLSVVHDNIASVANWAGYDATRRTWLVGKTGPSPYLRFTYGAVTQVPVSYPDHPYAGGSGLWGAAAPGVIVVPVATSSTTTGAAYSTDGGRNFTVDSNSGRLTGRSLVCDGKRVLAVGDGAAVTNTISTTDGASWQSTAGTHGFTVSVLDYANDGEGVVLCVSSNRAVATWALSSNQGASWATGNLASFSELNCCCYHEGYWFLGGFYPSGAPALVKSLNGNSWTPASCDMSWLPNAGTKKILSLASFGSALVAALSVVTDGTVLLIASFDMGETWAPVSEIQANGSCKLFSNGKRLMALVNGQALLSASL